MTRNDGETLSSVLARCSGPLLGVHRVRARDPITGDDILSCEDVEALKLRFSGVEMWVVCKGATDELHLGFTGPKWPTALAVDLSEEPAWRRVIGMELG